MQTRVTPTAAATDALTVAEYSARMVRALRAVGGGVVEGEVQEPKRSSGGMLFFELTDGVANIRCKVFPRQVAALDHQPKHGDLVKVRVDRPDLYVARGSLSVIVSAVELAGDGELLRRREELLTRLVSEGLCDPDRRKRLPRFPRAVGVISGLGSDGLGDVVAALRDRFPPVHIVTCTALVQGARAPLDIIDALARLGSHPLVDVIVIARGGGSVQDLVAFDDERLCRAVFASDTPVIAAIGHTDNVPVCNHVAWAKETPSRSPELAVPSAAEVRGELELAAARLAPLPGSVRRLQDSVAGVALDTEKALRARAMEVSDAAGALREAEHDFFSARQACLAEAREALAGVPGRIPDAADVDALAGRLDTCAVAFFSAYADQVRNAADFTSPVLSGLGARAERLRATGSELRRVSAALTERHLAVTGAAPRAQVVVSALGTRRRNADEQGERLAAGMRKELADHVRDYGRALARHTQDIRAAALRRLDEELRRTGDADGGHDVPYKCLLADAWRDLAHVAALLAASDPRQRGWVLATDEVGAAVRSARQLAVGQRLALSFQDGAAGTVVDTIPDQEQP